MRRLLAAAAATLLSLALLPVLAAPAAADVDPGTGTVFDRTPVVVPMVFPVVGPTQHSDAWLACRSGCARRHMGQDLMGPKMSPLVAAFDGVITSLSRTNGSLVLAADRGPAAGWSAVYLHLNNDTPGTDDGLGADRWAVPAGLEVGSRVLAGQLVGWRGDSGNAEQTGPHLHVELRKGVGWDGTVHNAHLSLLAARRLAAPLPSGPHPSGTLLRHPTRAHYLLDGEVKRPVSATVLASLGRSPADAVPMGVAESLSYRTGPAVPPRDGAVVRDPRGTTWLVTGGARARARLPQLGALGLAAPRVWPVAAADLGALPETTLPTSPGYPGALLRVDGQLQHVGSDGLRHPVSAAAAGSHGWSTPDVLVPAADAVLPGEGAPLGLRDGSLVTTSGPRVGVVSGGAFRRLHDVRQVAAYGYAGRPRRAVPPAEVDGLRTAALTAA